MDSDDEPDSEGGGYQEGQPSEPSPAQLASVHLEDAVAQFPRASVNTREMPHAVSSGDNDDGVVWHAKVSWCQSLEYERSCPDRPLSPTRFCSFRTCSGLVMR